MEFEIKQITTNELNYKNLNIDLNDLEQFISSRLMKLNFGKAVDKYLWGFELYKFDGGFAQFFNNDIESWKYSTKRLVTNSHFDWNVVKDISKDELFELIKIEMLKSISRINEMKRKPKNFDYLAFQNSMEIILNDYKK